MKILKNISVPTGNIIVADGEYGNLEFLSIGDYGKDVNLKCDAMGLTGDIDKVQHQQMLPLEKKWVITISTQYGCSVGCNFCDVPQVGRGKNASFKDMISQVRIAMWLHQEVTYTERLNLHYARMGEPTFNFDVIRSTYFLAGQFARTMWGFHPVISTMMPLKNSILQKFLLEWMYIKNEVMAGDAGLQLSINSTNQRERDNIFNRKAYSLSGIANIMKSLPKPKGRKITLNFAIADWEISPEKLLTRFSPDDYIIKLTPMHKTHEAIKNDVRTHGDYTTMHPYKEHEEALKKAGYDVLVFIASEEEDLSRITCGNAILSGSNLDVD